MGTVSEAYPHLILDNFSSRLGSRVSNILKHLFPVPKPDTKRVITFANQVDGEGLGLATWRRPASGSMHMTIPASVVQLL